MTRYPQSIVSAVALSLLLAGCASPRHKAPVEDRGAARTAPAPATVPAVPADPSTSVVTSPRIRVHATVMLLLTAVRRRSSREPAPRLPTS